MRLSETLERASNAFCKMCVTVCGKFVPDKGVQIAGLIFQTRSGACPNAFCKMCVIVCENFVPNSVAVAHYGAPSRIKSPANCDANFVDCRNVFRGMLRTMVYKVLIIPSIEGESGICYHECTKRINTLIMQRKGDKVPMITLDYQDRRPLYEQVEEKLRHLIINGALEPGSRMPSVRQLAMELSINPNTIQRAYAQLEGEGLIYPVKGKGNFIADSEEIRRLSVASYTKELKQLVRRGKALGMKEEEMLFTIRECYREEKI